MKKAAFLLYCGRLGTLIFCSCLFPFNFAFALASWQKDCFELHASSNEKIQGRKSKFQADRSILCALFFSFSSSPRAGGGSSEQYVKDYNAGLEAQNRRDYDGAIDYYNQALGQKQDFPDAWNNLAYCYRMAAMPYLKKSGEAYDRALQYEPRHAKALEYQGQYFVMMGELAKAYSNYQMLQKLDPKEAAILKKRLDAVLRQAQDVLKTYSP